MSTKRNDSNGKLPEIPDDGAGIPTFVFAGAQTKERPTKDKKALEVMLVWKDTLLSVGHYDKPRTITVGDDVRNDFRISCAALKDQRFSLLGSEGEDFVVNWAEGMALEVQNEAGDVLDKGALEEKGLVKSNGGVFQYKIGLHDKLAVQVDQITFVIQYVVPSAKVETSLVKTVDFYFTRILGFSLLGYLFVLLALLLTPPEPAGLDEDLFKNPNRFAQVLLKMEEKKPERKKQELSGKKAGGKHKDKEGKFGKVEEKKKDALASQKGAPKVDPNKREKDRKIALDSGLFKALKGNTGSVSDVFGPGGLGSGVNKALGGLRGTEGGTAGGAGGLGSRGTGPGGGGNSLGIGGLGDGTGIGAGGMGDVDLGGRGKGQYKVEVGRTITKGCMTADQALRVFTRVTSQAKYCYEKELPRNPNLAGKIATTVVINATGAVDSASVAESTMGNDTVEQCLLRVVQRLRFPACSGGGTTEVTYPWIFTSGGAAK